MKSGKVKKIILLLLPAVIAAGLFSAGGFRTFLTKLIVPGQRLKTYETYLAPEKMELRQIEKQEGGPRNLFVNAMVTHEMNGLMITLNPDGSVTFDGTYTGEGRWLNMSRTEQYLDGAPSGSLYYFSDGGFTEAAGGYAEVIFGGRNPDLEDFRVERVLDVKTEHFFTSDQRYPYYWAGFHFYKGFTADHLTVRPMLCRADQKKQDYEFSPCSMMYYKESGKNLSKYGVFRIPKNEYENMTSKEREFFLRNIESQYQSEFEWITVEFEDHTGIWFPDCAPEKAVSGVPDALGRVNNR